MTATSAAWDQQVHYRGPCAATKCAGLLTTWEDVLQETKLRWISGHSEIHSPTTLTPALCWLRCPHSSVPTADCHSMFVRDKDTKNAREILLGLQKDLSKQSSFPLELGRLESGHA